MASFTLFDIPSVVPNQAWSMNTLKARYTLNYKGLHFKTEWIEYPDIEDFYKTNGIVHTETRGDGSPNYTLPVLFDSAHNTYISGSTNIASHLDKAYPDTPKVFPNGSEGLARGFEDAMENAIEPIWALLLPKVPVYLNTASKAYFLRTKPRSRVELDQETKREEWARLRAGFSKIASWSAPEGGLFVMGDAPTFVDLFMGGLVYWVKLTCGENSAEWKDMSTWDEGRWDKLLKAVEVYGTVV
ncbi:hypothetical protein CYLTODRAFT_352122 [Cylindrobasidium torrendii FP15055 ss-10]|uniref:GST N-terminal domain-containing protein n=1 Tax=Cylindrobasidium torrendii FP15055 ss-10 TaxID=1314674 RepID=A0A0D7BBS3_9AGAR|nr:hypothetical protein CYLTODRAFT_352122 [Cylindrobasidium torrendii FP15055 ss-10]